MNKTLFFLLISLIFSGAGIQAQELPPCGERALLAEYPRVVSRLWCIEWPLHADEEWSFTSLAFTADGSFYATNPYRGLLELLDTDGDRMPDTYEILVEDLRLPNGLAAEGNRLYILGDGVLYHYENGEITTIADDLPSGRGFMARGIAVQEGHIYIGIPYPCDVCEADNELYGTVLSMDSNGENRQIVARGLRYPAGLAFHEGALWVSDSARDGLSQEEPLDEINRIDLNGEIPHFGFPYCIGNENQPDFSGDFDCASATAPTWRILAHSNVLALDTYSGETFPWLRDQLLVSLGGSFDNSIIRGYSLIAVKALEDGRLQSELILPVDLAITNSQLSRRRTDIIQLDNAEYVNQRGAGIWPHRLYDVAISPEGWIYASVGGEGIYVLRPGNNTIEEICQSMRDCD